MSINYVKYKKLKREAENHLARSIYNSPQNLASATYYEKRRTLIVLYCLFVVPGIIYHLFVWNKINNIFVEKYDNIISLLWRRASTRDQIVGTPNIVSSSNELSLPDEEYTPEQLEKVMAAIVSKSESIHTSLKPFNNVDNSLHKTLKKYGLNDLFFDYEAGEHSKEKLNKFNKIVHSENHVSSTTKLLFTYSKTVFDVTNYITSTRMIIKNEKDEHPFEYMQTENVAGIAITSPKTIVDDVELILVSKDWKSKTIPDGYRDITDMFDPILKTKFKAYTTQDETGDIKDFMTPTLTKRIVEVSKDMTPFIIKVCSNSELSVIWEEIDKTLRPLSEGDLIRFVTEHKYGVRTLSKEVFYIKQMYDILDVFYESGLI